MDKPIYFTRMYFIKEIWGMNEILVLNLSARELSFQRENSHRREEGAAISGITKLSLRDKVIPIEFRMPARMISHQKTGFQPRMVQDEWDEWEVGFSHKINLTETDVQELLPYCNARDFEPFRHRTMTFDEPGYAGYRDELKRMFFVGFTDSHLPKIKLPMDLIYNEPYAWPSERLLRYIERTFFIDKKTKKPWLYL